MNSFINNFIESNPNSIGQSNLKIIPLLSIMLMIPFLSTHTQCIVAVRTTAFPNTFLDVCFSH